MATEKRKINRVIDAAGNTIQVLPETSAEQVTLADAGNKFTSTNVEGALAEVAQDIAELETGLANAGKVDDVQDVNGATIVTNKIAKLSKAAVGLGNVDNTADANKSVKHATSADSATTATSANTANSATKATQDASGNVITSTYATKTELQNGLAGKSQSKTYNNYQAFVTAVNTMNNTALKVGDNVFIVTQNVPDMWVSAVNSSSATYTYTSDSAIVTALGSANGLTVGYYVFRELETEKVDLTAYQTKTDNGLNTTSKTVVGAINEVKGTADSALSKANANATEITNIKNGTTKVKSAEHADTADSATSAGSATNATNATNVTTNINGHAITDIFERDGTTVKNATHASSVFSLENILGIIASKSTSAPEYVEIAFDGTENQEVIFAYKEFLASKSTDEYGTPMLAIGLAPTGVTAGQYSAVNVDAKGRVTAGGKSIEWGTSGQTTPSGDLMVGGLFMELQ